MLEAGGLWVRVREGGESHLGRLLTDGCIGAEGKELQGGEQGPLSQEASPEAVSLAGRSVPG